MDAIGAGGGIIYLSLIVFLFFVAVLWFFMPFAIFGTKDKLQTLIDETRLNTLAINALHETMLKNRE